MVDSLGIGVGGTLISLQHGGAAQHFLPIYDEREMIVVGFVYGIVIPFIWYFYIRDLQAIPAMFLRLNDSNVIFRRDSGSEGKWTKVNLESELKLEASNFNRWRNLVFALVFTLTVAALVVHAIFAPARSDPFRLGYGADNVWWSVNRLYLGVIWAPITFSAAYMVSWILCRRVVASNALRLLYKKYRMIPVVLHPDGANGLAPVGNFAMRLLILAFLAAVWISFFVFLPVIFGFPPNLKLDTYLYMVGYIVALPIILFVPVWSTHAAMRDAKIRMLTTVAKNANYILLADEYNGSDGSTETDAQVSEAELRRRKFQLISERVGVWPFARPLLIRNVLGAAVPLLPAVLSFIVQNLSKIVSVSIRH